MVEEKKEITREYVEQVYNELGHYIIIGLTYSLRFGVLNDQRYTMCRGKT